MNVIKGKFQKHLILPVNQEGIRPAINAGLSVSRVGSAAQTKAMRSVAGSLRLDLAQYSELVTFAQFGTSDLDAATLQQLERGQRSTEILKQGINAPLSVEEQVVSLYALSNGFLDDVEVEKVLTFEKEFLAFMRSNHNDILSEISSSGEISDSVEAKLKESINEFKTNVSF